MGEKGTGSNFFEAITSYFQKSVLCDSDILSNLKISFSPFSSVSPLYVGINVRHTVDETLEYLKLFNKLNQDNLNLFLPYLSKSSFHKQTFSTPTSSGSDKVKKTENDSSKLDSDNTVLVLSDSENIALLDHFHVTLYYLGVDKKSSDMIKQDVEKVAEYLKEKNPDFKEMLNTLTLYEFSVCLMYRYLYKMTLPFETAQTTKDHDEEGSFRYLVLVPGVVFFAITELKKPLFAIPPKDFKAVKASEPSEPAGNETFKPSGLLKHLKSNVLIESDHSTHVTLGTSKDFKPVISNQICTSLLHFLDNCDSSNVQLYSNLKTNPDSSRSDLRKQLNKHLKVYNSGECKYDNLKEVFEESVPYLLEYTPTDKTELPQKFTLNDSSKSNKRAKDTVAEASDKNMFPNTKVFVSDDYKWFYFNNLQATRTLHPDPAKERFDWSIDVYVVSYAKKVQGNIHFNQK